MILTLTLKNASLVDRNWGGNTVYASSFQILEEVDKLRLISDSIFVADLAAGIAVISDGEYDLNYRVGYALLKDDSITIAEHYTLVQDDDILMGNGKILFLNEDSWEDDDEYIEDDVPTEE